ncbi:hypothetical protein LEP1GSC060_0940 [Leptospira weilii serovar Ranarum str. ICFT]|uniref:Uncharacterized protein n=1 Tax=Leptospira weilii serovar Ranarum str. ICFT TaxID=1218598 RepID=N1WJA2_9LEPT|nr:hypothetical protein [Leptospira weilii]EMY79005.1 hypothetical protein LEP1GSC060_0940 [Leptospira weilii serovar Ranarum str. ICFT]
MQKLNPIITNNVSLTKVEKTELCHRLIGVDEIDPADLGANSDPNFDPIRI